MYRFRQAQQMRERRGCGVGEFVHEDLHGLAVVAPARRAAGLAREAELQSQRSPVRRSAAGPREPRHFDECLRQLGRAPVHGPDIGGQPPKDRAQHAVNEIWHPSAEPWPHSFSLELQPLQTRIAGARRPGIRPPSHLPRSGCALATEMANVAIWSGTGGCNPKMRIVRLAGRKSAVGLTKCHKIVVIF